ncbi:MAG: DUF4286 family protein [Muribaculaceae bacterium]
MIVFNTTYHAHNDSVEQFLKWIREEYIPVAITSEALKNPRLTLIMAHEDGDNGHSYSLQFDVSTVDELEKWYSETGAHLLSDMTSRFANNVVGFTTIMNILDL